MSTEAINTFLNIEPIDLEYAGLEKGSLKGEVAVITGAASNIGLGFARAIAWAGAKVVVADINEAAGVEAVRVINLENEPDTAMFVKCDISKESDIKNMAAVSVEKFGKIDILLNNAMDLSLNGAVLDSPVSDLEKSFALSGFAVMHAIKEIVPAMIARGHGVVVFSSSQFHYAPPLVGGAMYCAGKAIGSSITMSLANEIKGTGVNVFCVTPAGVMRFDPSRRPRSETPTEDRRVYTPTMPGFNGMIPPEAGGAAMVYCILNASTLHGSGIIISDAFDAMGYPYPNPETRRKERARRLSDSELTLVLMNMGPGFTGVG